MPRTEAERRDRDAATGSGESNKGTPLRPDRALYSRRPPSLRRLAFVADLAPLSLARATHTPNFSRVGQRPLQAVLGHFALAAHTFGVADAVTRGRGGTARGRCLCSVPGRTKPVGAGTDSDEARCRLGDAQRHRDPGPWNLGCLRALRNDQQLVGRAHFALLDARDGRLVRR